MCGLDSAALDPKFQLLASKITPTVVRRDQNNPFRGTTEAWQVTTQGRRGATKDRPAAAAGSSVVVVRGTQYFVFSLSLRLCRHSFYR